MEAQGFLLRPWRPFCGVSTTFADLGPCPLSDILTPLPFDFFGFSVTRQTAMPIRTAPRFCLGGCGRFEKLLYGCRDPWRLHVSGALGLFLTHKQCDVETGQMSAAETGQMSAFETRQISAAETGQMSVSVSYTHLTLPTIYSV